jgi:predicted branched-subunit amino acid permease
LIGATLGEAIPPSVALEFAVPITFLAMVAPMLRTLAHQAAALVAILGALGVAGLPSGLGILVTAPLAMATGAWVEARCERLRARRLA